MTTILNALTALEKYWRDVLKLPGVPNTEARDITNYTVVDNYLRLKEILEMEICYYE